MDHGHSRGPCNDRILEVIKVRRVCPGFYTVTKDDRQVVITARKDLKGWMAIAQWDRYLYTDIVPTYREAKVNAIHMLED